MAQLSFLRDRGLFGGEAGGDVGAELFVLLVAADDLAVGVDNDYRGNSGDAVELGGNRLGVEDLRPGQGEFLDSLAGVVGFVPDGYADNVEAFGAVFLKQVFDDGCLATAGPAPACPEVDQRVAAFLKHVAELRSLAFEGNGEVFVGLSDRGFAALGEHFLEAGHFLARSKLGILFQGFVELRFVEASCHVYEEIVADGVVGVLFEGVGVELLIFGLKGFGFGFEGRVARQGAETAHDFAEFLVDVVHLGVERSPFGLFGGRVEHDVGRFEDECAYAVVFEHHSGEHGLVDLAAEQGLVVGNDNAVDLGAVVDVDDIGHIVIGLGLGREGHAEAVVPRGGGLGAGGESASGAGEDCQDCLLHIDMVVGWLFLAVDVAQKSLYGYAELIVGAFDNGGRVVENLDVGLELLVFEI